MFEERKIQHADLKRALRKGIIANCREDPDSSTCDVCVSELLSQRPNIQVALWHNKVHIQATSYSNALPLSSENTTLGKMSRTIMRISKDAIL